MKKRYKLLIALTIILPLSCYLVPIHVLPYAIIQPPRINGINYLETQQFEYEKIDVVSFDSIILKGYYVKSKLPTTKASLILVHGIGGCKEHFSKLAISLSKAGYDCWLFDNRAHGESEGLYTTYGAFERRDIKAIVTTIKKNTPDTEVGIWGNSLGAAIALQALEYDSRLSFGIIESSFANLRQIVYDYQQRICYGVSLKFACNISLKEAGIIAKFNPDNVSPVESASNINQPVMICHGDVDKNINVSYGKAIFENLKSKDKELVIVEGGGHFDLFGSGGKSYKTKLFNFLERQSLE
ncbi:alpha/beta hydrolase [Hyunsoonleella sp. 2307UL5-6]|uniref:alpha/beta hydrolase n=1 Tax=Hyunsoonleella sp. 2307UL5-6 TaxID=3384768 RepID=UPI0039BC2A36